MFGPLLTTLIAAALGLFSTAYVTYLNGKNQLELETIRDNTTLIVEAVKTGARDPSIAQKNLQFFLDAGLLADPAGRIAKLVKEGKNPVLAVEPPPQSPERTAKVPEFKEERLNVSVGGGTIVMTSSMPPTDVHKQFLPQITLADAPLIDAEILFKQPGPPQSTEFLKPMERAFLSVV